MDDKKGVGASRGQPTLAVAVCPVRRMLDNEVYDSCNYDVCLVREAGAERCGTITGIVPPGTHPERAALRELQSQTHLTGSSLIPLHIQAQPHRGEHVVTLFYLAPVSRLEDAHGFPSVETAFENLQFVLDNQDDEYLMVYGHRDMILAVDSWLRDQHKLDEVSSHLDLIFPEEPTQQENVPGRLKFAIDLNPLHEEKIEPIEDCLLIGFNNPLFTNLEV